MYSLCARCSCKHLTCRNSLKLNNSTNFIPLSCPFYRWDDWCGGGGVVGLSNLPKATKQLQWLQTPVWPLPYTAPCYPINSQSLGLSHRRKGQWLVTMIFLLSQLLDCLRRSFGFCGDGVAWELSCSLGSSCDDLGHGWNFESELFLRDALIMTFIFFFWL